MARDRKMSLALLTAIAMASPYMDIIEYGFINENEAKANAAFIVKACNCHEELVAACKEAMLQINYLQLKFKETGSGNATLAHLGSIIAKAEE
jgi:hypothetical protein